jgi:hypothetical protein
MMPPTYWLGHANDQQLLDKSSHYWSITTSKIRFATEYGPPAALHLVK